MVGSRLEADVHVVTRRGFDPGPYNAVTAGLALGWIGLLLSCIDDPDPCILIEAMRRAISCTRSLPKARSVAPRVVSMINTSAFTSPNRAARRRFAPLPR